MKSTRGYFLLLDLLGFSRIVSNLNPQELTQRMGGDWVNLIGRTAADLHVNDIQLLSDTLFAREHDSNDGLDRLLRFARALLEGGIQESLPIRGAITYGDVTWGPLIYGKPVIEAHGLEKSQNWIGISCAPKTTRAWKPFGVGTS